MRGERKFNKLLCDNNNNSTNKDNAKKNTG